VTGEAANSNEEGAGPRLVCEGEHPRVGSCWLRGAARVAGGAVGGGARAAPPLPAAGGLREPLEFPRAGGRCGRGLGSLQVTLRAAPAGPSAPLCERSWARSGRGLSTAAESRAPPGGPGRGAAPHRAAALLEDLVPGPGLWLGTPAQGVVRPGVSSTWDKGSGVEGARPACPRPGLRLLRSPAEAVVATPVQASPTAPECSLARSALGGAAT
jgi:hypothetical protein